MTSLEAQITRVVDSLAADAAGDYVGLWQVAKRTASSSALDQVAVLPACLAVVRQLLGRGLQVGNLAGDGRFVAWDDQTPEAVTRRIAAEWKGLGRPVDIGDICWFDLPNELPR